MSESRDFDMEITLKGTEDDTDRVFDVLADLYQTATIQAEGILTVLKIDGVATFDRINKAVDTILETIGAVVGVEYLMT